MATSVTPMKKKTRTGSGLVARIPKAAPGLRTWVRWKKPSITGISSA